MSKAWLHPLLFFLLLISACGEPENPAQVAAGFWKSIQARDLNLLYKHVARETVKQYKLDDMPAIGMVSLGETVVDNDKARVETTVEIKDVNSLQIPVTTFLVKHGKDWKVDFDETLQSVSMNSKIARMFSNIGQAGDKFVQQLNDVISQYQQSIPEVQRQLKKLEDRIKLQIPEIKDRLEEFAKEIDKAIKKPPGKKPDQPIKI